MHGGTHCVGNRGDPGGQPEEKVQVGPVPSPCVGTQGWDTKEEQKERGRLSSGASPLEPCDFGQGLSPERMAFFLIEDK